MDWLSSRPRRLEAGLLLSAAFVLTASSARADFHVAFPYRDAEFLYPGESEGGMVYVPDGASANEPIPIVVLLHGVNVDKGLHMWLGGRGEPDLTPIIEQMVASGASRPFILAAPSQTKGAMSGRHMWADFDLDDFVRVTDERLVGHARSDHDAVIVLGHSGGGCNPDGGLLRVARAPGLIVPRALLAIDTCMDEESGAALGEAPSSAHVLVRWQSEIWPRPLDRFRVAFRDAAADSGQTPPFIELVNGLDEPVHETILVETFRTMIPALIARDPIARAP